MTRKGRSQVFISSTLTAILQALCRTTAPKKSYAGLPRGMCSPTKKKRSCGRRQLRNRPKKQHSSKKTMSPLQSVLKSSSPNSMNLSSKLLTWRKKGCRCIKACSQTRKGRKPLSLLMMSRVSNGPCSTSTRTAQNVLPRTPVKRDVSMSLAGWTRLKNPRC